MHKKNPKQIQLSLANFRKAFTVVLLFNFAFLLERTTFDFMGFMFGMIIADLTYLVFLIIGLFGAYQYRVNYIVALTLSSVFWIAWNLFVVCVYMNVGILNRYEPFILNLNTSKKSWWFSNNIGCLSTIPPDYLLLVHQRQQQDHQSSSQIVNVHQFNSTMNQSIAILKNNNNNEFNFNTNAQQSIRYNQHSNYTFLDSFLQENCFLPFYWIEIIQCGILIFFSVLCIIFGLLLSNVYNEDDDTFDYIGGFDSVNVMSSSNNNLTSEHQQQSLQRGGVNNSQIKIEPFYAFGGGGGVGLGPGAKF